MPADVKPASCGHRSAARAASFWRSEVFCPPGRPRLGCARSRWVLRSRSSVRSRCGSLLAGATPRQVLAHSSRVVTVARRRFVWGHTAAVRDPARAEPCLTRGCPSGCCSGGGWVDTAERRLDLGLACTGGPRSSDSQRRSTRHPWDWRAPSRKGSVPAEIAGNFRVSPGGGILAVPEVAVGLQDRQLARDCRVSYPLPTGQGLVLGYPLPGAGILVEEVVKALFRAGGTAVKQVALPRAVLARTPFHVRAVHLKGDAATQAGARDHRVRSQRGPSPRIPASSTCRARRAGRASGSPSWRRSGESACGSRRPRTPSSRIVRPLLTWTG